MPNSSPSLLTRQSSNSTGQLSPLDCPQLPSSSSSSSSWQSCTRKTGGPTDEQGERSCTTSSTPATGQATTQPRLPAEAEISCKPSRKMTTDSKTILAGFQSDSTELKYSRWGNEDVGDSEEWGEPTAPRPLVKITLKAIAVRLWGTNVKLVLYIFYI